MTKARKKARPSAEGDVRKRFNDPRALHAIVRRMTGIWANVPEYESSFFDMRDDSGLLSTRHLIAVLQDRRVKK